MASSAVIAAAAAARRKKIAASGAFGSVVTVSPDEFLRAIALESEPMIVRHVVTHFWSDEVKKYRWLAPVRGLMFFCESTGEPQWPESAIVIEADKITVPSDL